ncbi:MAG: hypothetical protein AABW85_02490 [archaeon]
MGEAKHQGIGKFCSAFKVNVTNWQKKHLKLFNCQFVEGANVYGKKRTRLIHKERKGFAGRKKAGFDFGKAWEKPFGACGTD